MKHVLRVYELPACFAAAAAARTCQSNDVIHERHLGSSLFVQCTHALHGVRKRPQQQLQPAASGRRLQYTVDAIACRHIKG